MAGKVHVERMMYRNSISVPGESAASYALVKLVPAADAPKAGGLNLAMVLDVSGSMYEEDGNGRGRLKRIQEAALSGIKRMREDDQISIIAFGQDAKVILPSTSLGDRSRIEETIRRIDMYDVDPGGTSMDQGIALGLSEVEKSA